VSSSLQHAVDAEELPDPAPKPIRRSFTTEYRHRVVAEYEAAPHGEKSGVLRRPALEFSEPADLHHRAPRIKSGPDLPGLDFARQT
jgi:hypothetical protein